MNGTAPASWRLVAAREMSVKMRDKTFLLSTAFMLLVVAGSIGISAFLGSRTSEQTVVVTSDEGAWLVAAANDLSDRDDAGVSLEPTQVDSAPEAETLLRSEEADLALLPAGQGWEVAAATEIDGSAGDLLAQAVEDSVIADNAASVGTTAEVVLEGTELTQRLLDADALDPGVRYLLGFAFAFLFFITALTFGLAIAQSVIEEKQSRVVEILAATVPVRDLLWGKVVGNTVLAIGQVGLLALVGFAGLQVSGQGAVFGVVGPAGLWFVVYFLLGFGALASLWAVAGSVATRQEDLQATTMPVQTVVMGAFFVGLFATGQLLTVASFVPLMSSVAMPVRMLSGDVPLWQPLASAGLVMVAAFFLVRLGARLYEGSLLRTDRRTGYREALRGAETHS